MVEMVIDYFGKGGLTALGEVGGEMCQRFLVCESQKTGQKEMPIWELHRVNRKKAKNKLWGMLPVSMSGKIGPELPVIFQPPHYCWHSCGHPSSSQVVR